MVMNGTRALVDRYYDALAAGDRIALRPLLRDDLAFRGPLATLDSADAYVRALGHVLERMAGVGRRAVFAAGDDVCQIYDVTFSDPAMSVPVAEWLRVRDGRIASIEMFLDARPFADFRR